MIGFCCGCSAPVYRRHLGGRRAFCAGPPVVESGVGWWLGPPSVLVPPLEVCDAVVFWLVMGKKWLAGADWGPGGGSEVGGWEG